MLNNLQRIRDLWANFRSQWQSCRSVWQDEVAQRFEKDYFEPWEPVIKELFRQVEELEKELLRAEIEVLE